MPGRPRLESHVYDAAQSLRREALRAMTVVDYATPLPGPLESACEAVRSFNPRTSGGAMIAPQAYRILGETMALAEVFPRPLGQLAKPLRPHERADVLLRTLWAYRGHGGDLTRTASGPCGQPRHGALSPLVSCTSANSPVGRVWQGSHALALYTAEMRVTGRAPQEVAGGSQRACRVEGIEASSCCEQFTYTIRAERVVGRGDVSQVPRRSLLGGS